MGSHTDYNEGFVLTMTIDRDIWVAASPRDDRIVKIMSMDLPGESEFSLDAIERDSLNRWANYVRGVIWEAQKNGLTVKGFNALIQSTVPVGSGVSSSAALEIGFGVLLREMNHWALNDLDLALLCQRAENEFVGVNCGILDQYTSLLGAAESALLLDCRDLRSEIVPIAKGIRVVICDTRAKRELTGTEYAERRWQCEEGAAYFAALFPHVKTLRDVDLDCFNENKSGLSEVIRKRCQFIIEENQRVLNMKTALERDDRSLIKQLTQQSYRGARDLYEIGSLEYEKMITAINAASGVIGARQAGAGFGGCMVAFVEQEQVERFVQEVKNHYLQLSNIDAHVYAVQAVAGAEELVFDKG
jgi:galactokinase